MKWKFSMKPFGLQGAPAKFQCLMDQVLQGTSKFAGAYIDDIAIYSETWSEHLEHVEEILKRLRAAGLTANPKKCKVGMAEMVYLGHKIARGQVKPEMSKIAAVRNYPKPRLKINVRSFLGLVGYYRKFIPNLESVAAPLSDLTKKNLKTFEWTAGCDSCPTEGITV